METTTPTAPKVQNKEHQKNYSMLLFLLAVVMEVVCKQNAHA